MVVLLISVAVLVGSCGFSGLIGFSTVSVFTSSSFPTFTFAVFSTVACVSPSSSSFAVSLTLTVTVTLPAVSAGTFAIVHVSCPRPSAVVS